MPTMTPRALVPTILLALTGCGMIQPAAGPGRPDGPVPVSWHNGAPDAGPATPIPDTWWAGFGSPELAALIAEAHRGNPDLAASRHRIVQAAARVRAAGAGLLPVLDLSGSASRGWRGGGRRPGDNFQAGFDAAYEFDLWGGNQAGVVSAEALRRATAYQRDILALTLGAEVATTYFQYLNLNDRLENARRILGIAERVLALVVRQAELGAASGLEVSQQRVAVASLRAGIPAFEQRRAETRNALAELLGTTPGALAIRSRSLDEVALPAISPGLPSELLTRRPDIRQAEAFIAAAAADVRQARAAMLPAIRLTAGTGYSSPELVNLFSPTGFLATLAAGLTAPIFDGGRLAALRDSTMAEEAEAVDAYRATVIAAFRDVEDALTAARFLAEVEAAQREALAAAEETYALAEARYRAGSAPFLTLLEAQRSLFQQEDALEQTRLARLTAAVALYRALGGGWCEDGCGANP